MPSAAEFIYALSKKAGIPEDNAELKTLLADPDLNKVTLPDAIYSTVNSTLMSEEAAKNHPKIKGHFFAAAYDAVDRNLENLVSALELSDDEKNIYKEKKTNDRIEYLNNVLNSKISGKIDALSKDKQTLAGEYQKQIDAIKAEKQRVEAELQAEKQNFTQHLSDLSYNQILQGYQYANEAVPRKAQDLTAKALVAEKLATIGAKAIYNNGNFVLKNAASPDLDYMENGQAVNFNTIVERVLAENKLLKVSDPNPQPKPQPAPQPQPGRFSPQTNYDNSVLGDMLKDLKGAQAQ